MTSASTPPTIAVIGCGPAGMFFLHAVEKRRKKLMEMGDEEGLAKLPQVTCFDSASQPGGVWKAAKAENEEEIDGGADTDADTSESDDDDDGLQIQPSKSFVHTKKTTNMYEALWTNGAKEFLEFPDYTFDEHFQSLSLPVYMPREAILEYIIARVVKNCPKIFDNAVFNTYVTHVEYDDEKSKFEVTIKDSEIGTSKTLYFDKCIWAAGENGKPTIPHGFTNILRTEGYRGQVMHSSAIGDLLTNVKGKTLLMVGDSFSAEDITLQAIKHGAEFVYILGRFCNGVCQEVERWPKDKAEVITSSALIGVNDDGYTLKFQDAKLDFIKYSQNVIEDGEKWDLENVDAVVLCTGYQENMNMLNPRLLEPFSWYAEDCFEEVPPNWKMKENSMTQFLGEIPASEFIYSEFVGVIPGIYRGMLIDNPNMMFIQEPNSSFPLLSIDVRANLLLSFITGEFQLPTKDKMEEWNTNLVLAAMDDTYTRYEMDPNYTQKWWDIAEKSEQINVTLEESYFSLKIKHISEDMSDAKYDFQMVNSDGELNEKGKAFVDMYLQQNKSRRDLNTFSEEDGNWRTYRDHDPSYFVSVHTGKVASPMKKPWVELADCLSEAL